MKVSELIEQLKTMNQDATVIVQSDPEGNGFHDARGADAAIDDGDGGYHSVENTAEECCLGESDWEQLKESPEAQCVIVFP